MQHRFRFSLLGPKVQLFQEGNAGVVIEKEAQAVCVYGTDAGHKKILCAIPLCHPKYLKGLEYVVEFDSDALAKVSVGDIKVVIDFEAHKCSNNKGARGYGSDAWGQEVSLAWDAEKELLF